MKQLQFMRTLGIIEGISFLVLLLIAMPLKYIWHWPLAVKYTGWAHGVLFVLYIYAAFAVYGTLKKSAGWLLLAVLAAFLPLGTFVFDRWLKKDEALLRQQ
jgi:integral membrane protein